MNKKLGPELFYIDKNGKLADADLHEGMLSGSSADEQRRLAMTRKTAKRLGFPASINRFLRHGPKE